MSEWTFVKLGSLAHFKNGLNFSKDNWGKGLKVIGVGDFKDYLYPQYETLDEINPDGVVRNEDYLEEGDFLFVRSNGNRFLIGRSLYIKNISENISHSGFTIRLRFTSSDVYKPFYVYIFKSSLIRSVLSLYGGGTNINNLNQEILSKLDVPLPCLSTQKKIAAILSAYDDLIENNRRRIALLEKMAEEIYREWFVRLRFPGYEQVKFHKGVPEGWEIKPLEKFCRRVTDGTHDTPKPTDEGYFLITGKNLKNGIVDFSGAYKISKQDHLKISNRSGLKSGDIIFSNIGTLGSIAMVTDNIEYSVKNIIIFKPVDKNQSVFLYYMLKEKYILEQLLLYSSGASQQFISLTVARKFNVLAPTASLINLFGNLVLPIQQQKNFLITSNLKLEQMRDRLLTRLISGKLSIENLDIQFPPSMAEKRL